MIRSALLWSSVFGFALYAWRDWFKSLCALIVLMAVIEHPDMPKTMFGIQGLNPWNILAASVASAWLLARRSEGLRSDLPPHVALMLGGYGTVVLVGFVRMMLDRAELSEYSTAYLVSEYLVNTLKWVLPAAMVYDGCRTRRRAVLAIVALLGIYFLLALQVIRWMPAGSVMSGEDLRYRTLKIIVNEIGYHRVNLSVLLAGASWATLALLPLVRRTSHRLGIVAAFLIVVYAQALTGGRTGYAAWGLVGLALGAVRWRKLLVLAPAGLVILAVAVPAARERMLQGFEPPDPDDAQYASGEIADGPDTYVVTAGRTLIWPYVIEKISRRPLVGYGRLAMERTGLKDFLAFTLNESFPHPHNAYLEMLLDNGWIGFAVVMPFYLFVVITACRLMRDARDPLFATVGGMALALTVALLVGAVGSQTFYPREGAVGMWCALGLLLRLSVERNRVGAVVRPTLQGAAPPGGRTAAQVARTALGSAATAPWPVADRTVR